jgi:hypothetical protein
MIIQRYQITFTAMINKNYVVTVFREHSELVFSEEHLQNTLQDMDLKFYAFF